MSKGAVVARIVSEYSDKGTKAAARDLQNSSKHFSDFASNVKKSFMLAGAAAGAFAIKIGVDSLKAAIADQKSQAILANTLKNTTGANKEAIEATRAYIKSTELRLGITDEELRPSLGALVTATHNVTKAEQIQQVALDISAARHKDLGQVSIALSKAYLGNFTALKKLAIPLSQSIIDSKDFNGAMRELSSSVGGAAAVAADTFSGRMERVKLGFEEAKKSLGEALLPVLERFLNIIVNNVLPKLQEWIETNKEKLAASLQKVATFLGHVVVAAAKFGAWIAHHMGAIKALASVMAGLWAGAKVMAFVKTLESLVAVFKAIRLAAATAAIAEAFATGGTSALAAAAAIATVGIVGAGVFSVISSGADDATTHMDGFASAADAAAASAALSFATILQGRASLGGMDDVNALDHKNQLSKQADLAALAEAKRKAAAEEARQKAIQAALDRQNAAAQAVADAKKFATEKALLALKKMGVNVKSETDPIELEAARQLLVKQGNILEQEKLEKIRQLADAHKAAADAAQKYADILAVFADGKISSTEIAVLASKWGETKEQVEAYIGKIVGANSTPANKDAVIALYESWGMTKDEATKYRDFVEALKDQKLSTDEIENLRKTWNLSKQQVIDYAKQVELGTIFDLTKLKDPGDTAAKGWQNALSDLNAYLDAVKIQSKGGTTPGGGSGTSGAEGTYVGGTFVPFAGYGSSSSGSNGSGSGYGGAFPSQMTPTNNAQAAIDAANRASLRSLDLGNTLAGSNALQALSDSMNPVSPQSLSGGTASFATSGFLAGASGTATGSSGGSSGAVNVVVNVAGSVTTQHDLTEAIRQNLQNGILSGRAVTFTGTSV